MSKETGALVMAVAFTVISVLGYVTNAHEWYMTVLNAFVAVFAVVMYVYYSRSGEP